MYMNHYCTFEDRWNGGQDTLHEYFKTEGMEDRIQYMNILRQKG